MKDKLEYEKAIRMEGEFWGQQLRGSQPDHRFRQRTTSPQNLWDDPQIEDLTRGTYKNRLRCPSRSKGLRVLELACGSGWLALELARQGHRVDACDISRNQIELARSYYKTVKNREKELGEIEYSVADLNRIEFPKDTYDFVVCWDGLHHILESRRLIQQVYSSLKVGGKFLAFDHIGQESRVVNLVNWAFVGSTFIFDPLTFVRLVYAKVVKRIPCKSRTLDEVDLFSPFEDVTGKEMINYVIETFGRKQVAFETTLAFGARWLARIRGPQRLRLAMVSLVKKVDGYLIRRGVVKGEYVFIEAKRS